MVDNKKTKMVNPEHYTEHYYLNECAGASQFLNNPYLLPTCFKESIRVADVQRGMSVIDIGYGRGEVLYYLAPIASKLVGVDYAEKAFEIAHRLLSELPDEIKSKIDLYWDDINNIFPSLGKFDRIFLLDVVEHMYQGQLEVMYEELLANHVKKGTVVVIHTPIIDTEAERRYNQGNAYQRIMHVSLYSFEEHTKYFKNVTRVERIGKGHIKIII